MADEKRHIIEHKDGRSYSVTKDAFQRIYEPEGFKITGEETPAAFVAVGVPAARKPRSRPSSKRPARDRSSIGTAAGPLPESRAEAVVDGRATEPADADGG